MTGTQKKNCFNADRVCGQYNKVFEAISCFFSLLSLFALTQEDIQRGTKNREIDKMQKQYSKEKGYTVAKMWIVNCRNCRRLMY